MPSHYLLPCLAEVVRAIDVRLEVVRLMALDRSVGSSSIEAPGLDDADHRELTHAWGRDRLPGCAVIFGQPNQAIRGADPDHALRHRRRREGIDRAPVGLRHGLGGLFGAQLLRVCSFGGGLGLLLRIDQIAARAVG